MTTRKKRSTDTAEHLSGNLRRTTTWAELRRGDPVEVSGTRLRSAKWEFLGHVRNIVTGDEWIEVVGGKSGDRNLRSFHPDRVFAPAEKKRKGAPRSSLADAPRLPFS